jgi:hypothetical protein
MRPKSLRELQNQIILNEYITSTGWIGEQKLTRDHHTGNVLSVFANEGRNDQFACPANQHSHLQHSFNPSVIPITMMNTLQPNFD